MSRERAKLHAELQKKYRDEFQRAKGWKLPRLKLKIYQEATRILRRHDDEMRTAALCLIFALGLPSFVATPSRSDPAPLQESAPVVRMELNGVISRQLAAFHSGDFAKAYTFAAAEIRHRYDQADFEQMVKLGFPILTRFRSTEFGPALDDGRNGLVYVRVSDAQGEQLYLYSLKREDKGWKIIGVSQRDEDKTPPPAPVAHRLPPLSA